MPAPIFFRDERYKGIGISEGLARGLQVMMDDTDLTQEGMGIGAVAIRSRGYTYFSRGSQVAWTDSQSMVQNYEIDSVLLSGRGGWADT